MAIAFVQALQATAGTSTTGNTTVTVTTNAAVTAGNHIIGMVGSRLTNANTLSSVSGGSLTWQVDKTQLGANTNGCGVFSAFCPSGLASGTTLTGTLSLSSTRKSMVVYEFSGLNTSSWVRGTPIAVATTGTNPSAGTYSGLTVGDLVVGAVQANTGSASQSITAGAGFTIPTAGDSIVGASTQSENVFEWLVAAATSQTVNFTSASFAYDAIGVAYIPAAAAAASPLQMRQSFVPMMMGARR